MSECSPTAARRGTPDDARLENPGGVALSADHAVIDGGLSLSGAVVRGAVRLRSTRITGRLDFAGTPADSGRAGDPACLNGTLDLRMARVGALHDEPGHGQRNCRWMIWSTRT